MKIRRALAVLLGDVSAVMSRMVGGDQAVADDARSARGPVRRAGASGDAEYTAARAALSNAIEWPRVCARCGGHLEPDDVAWLTVSDELDVKLSTGRSVIRGSMRFPVCAKGACRVDGAGNRRYQSPRLQLIQSANDRRPSHVVIVARAEFLHSAAVLNPETVSLVDSAQTAAQMSIDRTM